MGVKTMSEERKKTLKKVGILLLVLLLGIGSMVTIFTVVGKLLHEHDYNNTLTTVVPPTCTEKGYTHYVCECDEEYKGDWVDALGHDYQDKVVEPTETEKGYTEHKCTRCGDTYKDNYIDAVHVHKYDEKVTEPTCLDKGFTTYTCKCGDTYKDKYVDALGHKWGKWITVKEPTTTQTGNAYRECENCKEKENKTLDKEVPTHTHKYTSKVTKEASCSEEGTKKFTCACGVSYTEKIAKLKHNYTEKTVKPTCLDKGYTEHTCSRCKASYKDEYKDALGHKLTETVVKPTCTKDGYTKHECTRCDYSYTDKKVEAIGHDYKFTSDTATCTKAGTKTEECKNCGDKKTVASPALGHDYKKEVVKPTCEKGGYTEYTCSRCNDTYREDEKAAIGHDYKEIVKDATCTEDGYKVGTCANCQDSYTKKIDKLGHDYKSVVTEPSCLTEGYTTHTCSRCEDSYIDNNTNALGHSYKDTVVEPTYTEKGYTEHKCERCGDNYKDNFVDRLPRVYTVVLVNLHQSDNTFKTKVFGQISSDRPDIILTYSEADESGFVWKDLAYNGYAHTGYMTKSYWPGHEFILVPSGRDCMYDEDGYWQADRSDAIEGIWDRYEIVGEDKNTVTIKMFSGVIEDADEINLNQFDCGHGNVHMSEQGVAVETTENGLVLTWTYTFNKVHTHDYKETTTKKPTCTEPGEKTFECECGDSYKEEIPTTDHDYQETVVPPTDDEKGYTHHVCPDCGDDYKDEYVNALNHNVLVDGLTFRQAIDPNAKRIKFTNIAVPANVETTDVSLLQDGSVVAWYDGETMYVTAVDGGTILANEDCRFMFAPTTAGNTIENINFDNFDTSRTTTMKNMFYQCDDLVNLDVSSFNTSNVTDMEEVFHGCTRLETIDIRGWDTSKVTTMDFIFRVCSSLQEIKGINDIDVSNVENFGGVFQFCETLPSIDLSNWDTSSATEMNNMFNYCEALTELDLRNFDVSKVTTMRLMFSGSRNLKTLNLSTWEPTSLQNTDWMFYGCNELTTIYAQDWTSMTIPSESTELMFAYCHKLVGAVAYTERQWGWSMATPVTGYFWAPCSNVDGHNYKDTVVAPGCETDGCTTHICEHCGHSYTTDIVGSLGHNYGEAVTKQPECEADGVKTFTCSRCGDEYTEAIEKIGHAYKDTVVAPTGTTEGYTEHTCGNCGDTYRDNYKDPYSYILLNGPQFNSGLLNQLNIHMDMVVMFREGAAPSDLNSDYHWDLSEKHDGSVIGWWSTETVGGRQREIFNIATVDGHAILAHENSADMFASAPNLVAIDFSGLITSDVKDMSGMFKNCVSLKTLHLNSFDVSSVENAAEMFKGCSNLTTIYANEWTNVVAADGDTMFEGCNVLVGAVPYDSNKTNWDMANPNTGYFWAPCTNAGGHSYKDVVTAPGCETEGFTTHTCEHCGNSYKDTYVDKTGHSYESEVTKEATCTAKGQIDYTCSVCGKGYTETTEMLPHEYETTTTAPTSKNQGYDYHKCKNCKDNYTDNYVDPYNQIRQYISSFVDKNSTSITFTNIPVPEGVETSDVSVDGNGRVLLWNETDDNGAVHTYVTTIDGKTLYAHKIAGYIFNGCPDFTKITFINFDTSKSTMMNGMFSGQAAVKSLNLSGWNTSNVTYMNSMFDGCTNLTTLNVDGWDTSNVEDMYNMFENCKSLKKLDLSHFNTEKVTSFSSMFSNCLALEELDISGFNTANSNSIQEMFKNCESLKSLDLSNFDTSKTVYTLRIFYGCKSLETLTGLENWNMEKAFQLDGAFEYCSSLKELDLSGWKTTNAISYGFMFGYCDNLEVLHLDNFYMSFSTGDLFDLDYMFYQCPKLKTIYAQDWVAPGTSTGLRGHWMFSGCDSLVGKVALADVKTSNLSMAHTEGYFTHPSVKEKV